MRIHFKSALIIPMLTAFGLSCSLFDSGVEWREGPYALIWIDLPNEVSLSYNEGGGGWAPLVEKQVYAVGSNSKYIVAKQHPNGDKAKTNFYVLDRSKDEQHCVQGPMIEAEFAKASKDLGLPPFTKVLTSLE